MSSTEAPAIGDTHPASLGASAEAGLFELALQREFRPLAGTPEVPDYEVIDRLGSGSSGEVWFGEELENGRIVALKILHRHGAAGASEEIMQREIRMLAKLVHPNLVLLHRAIGSTAGRWTNGCSGTRT
jgi:serine/threonine protein kinase